MQGRYIGDIFVAVSFSHLKDLCDFLSAWWCSFYILDKIIFLNLFLTWIDFLDFHLVWVIMLWWICYDVIVGWGQGSWGQGYGNQGWGGYNQGYNQGYGGNQGYG